MPYWVVIVLFGVVAFVLLILIIRLYIMVNRLNSAIAKLGYVIREDAKKYFDEAAEKIIDTNGQFQKLYTKIVRDGTASALNDAGTVMEQTFEKAHGEAEAVVVKARDDARRILTAAQTETVTYVSRALGQSADTIQWVMEQYIKETYSVDQHRDLINKLLEEYINENRT